MKNSICSVGAILLLFLTVILSAKAQGEQELLADKLVRLHIIAESDDPVAQALKIKVRDALLPEMGAILEGCSDREEAVFRLRQSFPQFVAAAEKCLRDNGSSADVSLSLVRELFPERHYDSFSLPAGMYSSLKITIGSGNGQNWWCVVFPPLCADVISRNDLDSQDAFAGFSNNDIALISGSDEGFILKFKLLEVAALFRNLFNRPLRELSVDS